ncbi:general transcription and DNA repair factor IIH subunit Tfb2p [Trichomonascus vanleenenianus]|uniref:TFIIH/NER complex subunit TFB2 n=1 Tax=Trichomonascus vanleenenianus TaxID=2268995 RepID=UPI003ECB6454
MSMLFSDAPVQLGDIDLWVKQGSKKYQAEALKKLKGLHLVRERRHHQIVELSGTFRQSFKSALMATEDTLQYAFGKPCDNDDKHKVDIDFLDKYAAERWENVLHFMVGTPGRSEVPSEGIIQLLMHARLMTKADYGGYVITNDGFQFLLQDSNAQIWRFLIEYSNMATRLQMDPVDVLNFIFMLGSLELGKAYSLTSLSETQVQMLEDLRDYGLVYQRKFSSKRFYPTRLATTLTSDTTSALKSPSAAIEDAQSTGTSGQGFIILETNYRVYAYTDSPLQIAVLNLFVHLKSRFANMVTGHITRDSVRGALTNGIQAEQIIQYLTVHAHPQMRKTDPVLPPTVVDQIRLWQLELDRLKSTEGYLFHDFADFNEYNMIATYAAELGVLEWQQSSKRRFFVAQEGGQQVVDYVNKLKREKKP